MTACTTPSAFWSNLVDIVSNTIDLTWIVLLIGARGRVGGCGKEQREGECIFQNNSSLVQMEVCPFCKEPEHLGGGFKNSPKGADVL